MRRILLVLSLPIVFLGACSEGQAKQEIDYDHTKKMVVDILQTEDGKKAFRELIADEEMKKHLVIESDVVKQSINELLVTETGKKMWKDLFEDPKFVEGYAKSLSDEHKKLLKALMNDPEYQKQMLDLLNNPEVDKQIVDLMKSQKFRAHIEDITQQIIESPLFLAKIQDILLKAAKEKEQKEGEDKGKGNDDKEQNNEESDQSNEEESM